MLRYLAGTRSLGITYRRSAGTEANQLWATAASADADYAAADDRRSVSGWAVLMAGAMVNWASKRQPVTAISSIESEFYSVSLCSLDCVYLRRMMDMMGYKQRTATPISKTIMLVFIWSRVRACITELVTLIHGCITSVNWPGIRAVS